ncbi:hypothetical protein EVAR_90232_1 [Eumeta japonica]|uniref:Uncharacterized protein n=1 Tax=Eumeta variegata TaxID=151549 RepID=A0A4C1YMX7_EUMVA|nr:hypothetical protein EVAR_90232_1 [Eumeta japonica]
MYKDNAIHATLRARGCRRPAALREEAARDSGTELDSEVSRVHGGITVDRRARAGARHTYSLVIDRSAPPQERGARRQIALKRIPLRESGGRGGHRRCSRINDFFIDRPRPKT